jgi:hypothetical protein
MALSLRLRSGDVHPEPELPFDAPRVVIGRAPGCDLQLPDPSISPRHASLRQRGSDYVIVDEGSENGTFAGKMRLERHAPHPVRDGELLRFGRIWVEVRLGPAEHPVEARASRELARRLVDAALEADGKDWGMRVSVEGSDAVLCLAEPRRAYLVGGKKAADLRLTFPGAPSRCLELRRQADQLWVTLQNGAEALLDDQAIAAGERTAWPKNATLVVGEACLTLSDPTAQMLERLEREPTERLADDAAIDPPSGASGDEEDEETDDDEDEETDEDPNGGVDEVFGDGVASQLADATPRPTSARSGWTRADAVVFLLALSVLGLSLWAIRWLAHLGSA